MQGLLQTGVDALSLGSIYALLSLGIALIFGIMRLINFAYGELVMAAAYTIVLGIALPWPMLVTGAVGTAVLFALAMERLTFRPVRAATPATLLVTSFALSFLLQNLAAVVFGPTPRSVDLFPSMNKSTSVGSVDVPNLHMASIAITLILLAALTVFLKRTRLGLQMRAAAEDFEVTRLLGVRANVVIAVAFGISGGLAAVAAMLLVAQTGTVSPTMGTSIVLIAFVATVIGGMGSLMGATLAAFLVGTISVTLSTYLPLELRSFRDAFLFTAIVAILLLRPAGLVAPPSGSMRV